MLKEPAPSLLAALPHCPLDSASGSARSARAVCELLAREGWRVRFAGTTGSENGSHLDIPTLRVAYGIEATAYASDRIGHPYLTFTHRGIDYQLLDARGYSIDEARVHLAASMDALALSGPVPALSLTYGSCREEIRRRAKLRAQGTRIVFFLRNLAYFRKQSFAHVDSILTPSHFLSKEYFERCGVRSSHILPCLCPDEIAAPCAEPAFCTFINPEPEKGLHFFLEIVRASAESNPAIPFLAVESRAPGALGTYPLEKLNLHIARNTPDPRPIYAVTRVLLVPSICPDPGPRVIAEAQINGIPVIGSDRGGIPETIGTGGFALPVGTGHASAWLDLIRRLYEEPDHYQPARCAAHAAAAKYRDGEIDRLYLEFFRGVLQ